MVYQSISPLERLLLRNLDKPWNWQMLSRNEAITVEFIEYYSNFPWNWIDISKNKNITPKFVEKFIHKSWNWGRFGQIGRAHV